MKRTIRNGLAVVGMAGGMWFLGHAVANAATGTTPATGNDTTVSQPVTPSGGSSSSTGGTTASTGTNNNSTSAGTGNTNGGNGGGNGLDANSGATNSQPTSNTTSDTKTTPTTTSPTTTTPTTNYQGDPSKPVTSVTIVTGDVTANQQANGGSVADSGNVKADSTTKQSATSTNTTSSSSTGSSDKSGSKSSSSADQSTGSSSDKSSGSSTDQSSSSSNTGNGSGTNVSKSGNDNSTSVSTGNISGGNGGSNSVDINTGLIGNTFNCPPMSTCVYNITTGNVTVYQQANGGSVSNSGNVTIGSKQPEVAPAPAPAPAPSPSPSPSPQGVKTIKTVTVLSSAQPVGTLATTGADTSAPLTVGLLALGAGTALTLAGRRRREVQAA